MAVHVLVLLGIAHVITVTTGQINNQGYGQQTYEGFQTQNRPIDSQKPVQPGSMVVIQVQLSTTVTFIASPSSSTLSQYVVNNPQGLAVASQRVARREQSLQQQERVYQSLGLDNERSTSSSGLHTIFIGTKPFALELMEDKLRVDFLLEEIFREIPTEPGAQPGSQIPEDIVVYNKQDNPNPSQPLVATLTPPPPSSNPDFAFRAPSFPTGGVGSGGGGGGGGGFLPSSSSSPPPLRCQNSVNLTCNPSSRFRTLDGSCNNLRNNQWGASFIPMRRYLPPVFNDGRSQPRILSVADRSPLPSAREVSIRIHPDDRDGQVTTLTHMVMQWGQFTDHDITSTPVQTASDGSGLTCCEDDIPPRSKRLVDVSNRTECFPTPIPSNDPFFTGRRCLNFVRSVQVPNSDCQQRGPVEQLNQITAYIDASQVYGSTDDENRVLRTFRQGQLRTSRTDLLPRGPKESCEVDKPGDYCFKAGDERVNEQMALTSLHTVFMRHHNRLAQRLSQLNPVWDDERIFQETRKIVGAHLQKITYGDWLPIVLDRRRRQRNGLQLLTSGQRNVYLPQVDASIHNVFATAAFRFGHSLVRTTLSQMAANYQDRGQWRLEQSFSNTSHLLNSRGLGVAGYMRGLVRDAPNKVDRFFSGAIRDRLFLDKKGKSLDLVALNIQRGRDHGIPGYNSWRGFCGLAPVTFTSMPDHDPALARQFGRVYRHPDDIDVFSGAISERAEGGGLVGPTFACIIAKQFNVIKFGDRFWFETSDRITGFTSAQVEEIRKQTLSRILCDVTQIRKIQPNAFRQISNQNPLLNCEEIPEMNLEPWRETGKDVDQASWSSWSPWNQCQGGVQSRQRTCRQARRYGGGGYGGGGGGGGRQCSGPGREVRNCNGDPIWNMGRWTSWSAWSRCRGGYQRRSRMCQGYPTKRCSPGPSQQHRRCRGSIIVDPTQAPHPHPYPWPNPSSSGWGAWGPWAGACTGGKQWRRRTCRMAPRAKGWATLGACSGPSAQSRGCRVIRRKGGSWKSSSSSWNNRRRFCHYFGRVPGRC